MALKCKSAFLFKAAAAVTLSGLLAACGSDAPIDDASSALDASDEKLSQSAGNSPVATDAQIMDALGAYASAPHYIESFPGACALLSEAAARSKLNAETVVANPGNSGPESDTPRCAWRDGDAKGKSIALVTMRVPTVALNSRMPPSEILRRVNQQYGDGKTSYAADNERTGAYNFAAEAENSVSVIVMTGMGVAGGSYAPDKIDAEAVFSVMIRDPENSAEGLLLAARKLASDYNSNIINAAKPL